VNTIEGLTEEQAVEIVTRSETLAEEQTDELPRRKGARAAPVVEEPGRADEPPGDPDGESGPGEPLDAIGPDGDFPDGDDGDLSQTTTDTSTAEPGSASPIEPDGPVEGELSPDDGLDLEHDEASDDEIHDLALAVETSGYSPHGHEVTFRPSDDDQGETLRIVTEAVEQGNEGVPAEPPPSSAGQPSASAREAPPTRPAPPPDARDQETNERADDRS